MALKDSVFERLRQFFDAAWPVARRAAAWARVGVAEAWRWARPRLLRLWAAVCRLCVWMWPRVCRLGRKLKPRNKMWWFSYGFFFAVLVLFVLKTCHPEWTLTAYSPEVPDGQAGIDAADTVALHAAKVDSFFAQPRARIDYADSKGRQLRHKIFSVSNFSRAFPDLNDVQFATAERLGVSPVADRRQAEERKDELVFIGASPFYSVRPMSSGIPYLVPRAARLLEHIGRTFFDSLTVKNIAWSKIIVTSALRTEADVANLRQKNANASDRSCHRFGTTFDVSYSKYVNVCDPSLPPTRAVRDDTLKWVLSEVLNDARRSGLCYVKYEVHQGCFHITAR